MLNWEMAPISKCGNYKLVVTEKIDDELYLIIMRYGNSTIKISLNEVEHYEDQNLIDYIKELYPKILSGVYDINLLNK